MNILLVGGAGYLGGALTDLLAETGHDVLVYDRLLYEEMYRKNVRFVRGDVRDVAMIQPYLDSVDVVVWLAAIVGDPACALNETLTRAVNVDAVRYLRDHFDGRIVFLSSCSVYGSGDDVLHEGSPTSPLSLYAQTKLECEGILESANAITFRLGTLYGLSDAFSRIRFDLVINTLVMRAALHKKMSVFGGDQYRPLLHVRDVAHGLILGVESEKTGIYNLHAENKKIIDAARQVHAHFPHAELEVTDVMFQDKRNYRASSEKAKRELGFHPTLTVEDGIQELKALLDDGRIRDTFETRFSNYLHLKPLLTEVKSPLGRVVNVRT
jgi:nucleoside-diphosphate-sugar epimerase